jgi:hypothetical protein
VEPPPEAGFRVVERREEAGFEVVARLDAVERPVEDRREEAGFDAAEPLVEAVDDRRDEARFAAVERLVEDEARFAAVDDDAGFDAAVERREELDLRVPVERVEDARRAAGFLAAVPLAAVVARGLLSSAETRLPSPSMSLRRPFSSWSTRSSSTSRIRLAALARSPASSCAGPRSD